MTRYVIAWQRKTMAIPAFWYYDVDDAGGVTVNGDDTRIYDLMTLAGEVMTFVKDGSLVSFGPVKEK